MLYHVILSWIYGHALQMTWIIWHGKRYIHLEYFVVIMLFIFYLGNRTFIEKMNIVFMMMNTLDMKIIQKAQELKLIANRL